MPDDEQMDRRRFFRDGLRHLFGRIEKAAEPMQRFASEMAKLDGPAPVPLPKRGVTLSLPLRPPGALPEADYLSACTRCGECVKACPAECIVVDPAGVAAVGAPYIVAERKPCAVCDSLACMNVCPTGALQIVPRFSIAMGTAVWGEGKCVRGEGQECRICLEICPLGSAALDVDDEGRVVVKAACIGCGQCQHACPTTPRAIVVVPRK